MPVTRIEPRALIMPAGFPRLHVPHPDPPTRAITLDGRAWSGWAPVTASRSASTAARAGRLRSWRRRPGTAGGCGGRGRWDAATGRYRLAARAQDASGRGQPVDARWNRGGFANNLVQRVLLSS